MIKHILDQLNKALLEAQKDPAVQLDGHIVRNSAGKIQVRFTEDTRYVLRLR